MIDTSPRRYYLRRRDALHRERESFLTHWQKLSRNIQPRRSKFLTDERNRSRYSDHIINGTPIRAARILASGMMAGVTNRSRPWFRLTLPDTELAEWGPVRDWLYVCERILRTTFAKSNLYNGLHSTYLDLAWAGTPALLIDSDPDEIMRAYSYPIGQFAIASSARQRVNTFYLDLVMTVEQLVEKFGYEACSPRVRRHYDRHEYDVSVDVLFAIEPNRERDPTKLGPRGMAYKAVWLERGGRDTHGLLLESGYRDFPVMVPRWDVVAGDDYGSCPGMDALGDCEALQLLERRKTQAFTKVVNPPMVVPSSFLGREESFLPGDVIYADGTMTGQKIEPAWNIHPQVMSEFRQSIPEHEERIAQMFYADLWLSLTETDRREITATEIAERHEEKLLQLGPVMERLEDELLNPLIARAFDIHVERGFIPPPPEELAGMDLRVEYISILAQAQKLLGTSSLERMSNYVGTIAQMDPQILDKVDFDEAVSLYADSLGVPPSVIRTPEQVAAIREQRAAEEQARQEAADVMAATQGVKNLSGDIGDNSALERLIQGYGGAA